MILNSLLALFRKPAVKGKVRVPPKPNYKMEVFAWTERNTIAAQSMFRRGLSLGQIAIELGTTRSAVAGKLRRLGLMNQGLGNGRPVKGVFCVKKVA